GHVLEPRLRHLVAQRDQLLVGAGAARRAAPGPPPLGEAGDHAVPHAREQGLLLARDGVLGHRVVGPWFHSLPSSPAAPPTGSMGIPRRAMLLSPPGRSPGLPKHRSGAVPIGYAPTTRKSPLAATFLCATPAGITTTSPGSRSTVTPWSPPSCRWTMPLATP